MKRDLDKKLSPYLYILPSIILLLFVFFYPMGQLLVNSFYRISSGNRTFVGLFNYIYLITKDNLTHTAILNNFKILLTIPFLLFFAILFSILLYEEISGRKTYQTILFIPLALSNVVVGITFTYLLRVDGIINFILKNIGLEFLAKNWLGNPNLALFSVMGVIVWKELALGIILFLARLGSINESIYDAARIDGANWLQTIRYVTIPHLRPIINFYIVYNIMIMFAWIFTYVFVITKGGPANSTMIIELQIYKYAFERHQMGIASALSLLLFLIVFTFIYLQFKLRSGSLETSE
jgi:ABC-type sugar transport system permease subunit